MEINKKVGEPFFNRLESSVKALAKEGIKTIYLNTDLQMVIGENKRKAHFEFYPQSPLIEISAANCPQTIEEIEKMFLNAPVYPNSDKQASDENIAAILDKVETKPKKKAKEE